MPYRLTSPTVGRRPTMPSVSDGLMIEPEVSVPIVTIASAAAAAAPEPDDEPLGLRSASTAASTWPPTPEKPLGFVFVMKFAYSLRFSLPRITASAALRFAATVESAGGNE